MGLQTSFQICLSPKTFCLIHFGQTVPVIVQGRLVPARDVRHQATGLKQLCSFHGNAKEIQRMVH